MKDFLFSFSKITHFNYKISELWYEFYLTLIYIWIEFCLLLKSNNFNKQKFNILPYFHFLLSRHHYALTITIVWHQNLTFDKFYEILSIKCIIEKLFHCKNKWTLSTVVVYSPIFTCRSQWITGNQLFYVIHSLNAMNFLSHVHNGFKYPCYFFHLSKNISYNFII